jgi:hypothetical protein
MFCFSAKAETLCKHMGCEACHLAEGTACSVGQSVNGAVHIAVGICSAGGGHCQICSNALKRQIPTAEAVVISFIGGFGGSGAFIYGRVSQCNNLTGKEASVCVLEGHGIPALGCLGFGACVKEVHIDRTFLGGILESRYAEFQPDSLNLSGIAFQRDGKGFVFLLKLSTVEAYDSFLSLDRCTVGTNVPKAKGTLLCGGVL